MRSRRRCLPIAIAISASLLVSGCGASNESSPTRASASWANGTTKKNTAFAGIGIRGDTGRLVVASFKPTNDITADASPNNADFRINDWAFTVQLATPDGTLSTGSYSGTNLTKPFLYFYDAATKQVQSQALNADGATIAILSVTPTTATGTITLTDPGNRAALSAEFTAVVRTA